MVSRVVRDSLTIPTPCFSFTGTVSDKPLSRFSFAVTVSGGRSRRFSVPERSLTIHYTVSRVPEWSLTIHCAVSPVTELPLQTAPEAAQTGPQSYCAISSITPPTPSPPRIAVTPV